MLQSFRNFFQSKWGVALTLGFVALIAFAFASGDVANMGGLGSAGGKNTVAKVGKEKIEDAEVERSIQTILGRMRQQDPTANMATFLARNGLEDLLSYLIDRKAARQWGERLTGRWILHATASSWRNGALPMPNSARRFPKT